MNDRYYQFHKKSMEIKEEYEQATSNEVRQLWLMALGEATMKYLNENIEVEEKLNEKM